MNEGFGFEPGPLPPELKARLADRKAKERELTKLKHVREKGHLRVRAVNDGFGIACPTSPEMKVRLADRKAREDALATKKRERIRQWMRKHCAR